MLRSHPMLDPGTNTRVVVEADDQILEKICDQVCQSSAAMAALLNGYEEKAAALQRGDISSRTPPIEYSVIHKIMNEHDRRFAGTLGPKIIRHLEEKLIKKVS